MDISSRVKEANKKIYNDLNDSYEAIDNRRSGELCSWLRKRLEMISEIVGSEANLLDVGCGGGFVVRAAKGLFPKIYGADISENILKALPSYGGIPVCTDAQQFPFKNESMDAAVLFSVVHHFYDHRPILDEIYRVLKPGGIIYIDHDMNKYFFQNFRFFINIYRRLSHKERIFKNIGAQKLYSLSEFHSGGIDSERLKDHLMSLGFKIIKSYYHWYGLFPLANFIFRESEFSKNIAPLFGLVAQK